jgi:hypothetical protein
VGVAGAGVVVMGGITVAVGGTPVAVGVDGDAVAVGGAASGAIRNRLSALFQCVARYESRAGLALK